MTRESASWQVTSTGAASDSAELWAPMAVPSGRVVEVVVDLERARLETERLVARWSDAREAVRSEAGKLLWFDDGRWTAFRTDNRLTIVDAEDAILPRGPLGSDALMVRSLDDLADRANVDAVESISGDTIVLSGEDGCTATVTRSAATGIIIRGAGRSPSPWSLDLVSQVERPDDDYWFQLGDIHRAP